MMEMREPKTKPTNEPEEKYALMLCEKKKRSMALCYAYAAAKPKKNGYTEYFLFLYPNPPTQTRKTKERGIQIDRD